MDKGFAVLEIDQEFKTLIRPLRRDEYLQLEVNLTIVWTTRMRRTFLQIR